MKNGIEPRPGRGFIIGFIVVFLTCYFIWIGVDLCFGVDLLRHVPRWLVLFYPWFWGVFYLSWPNVKRLMRARRSRQVDNDSSDTGNRQSDGRPTLIQRRPER